MRARRWTALTLVASLFLLLALSAGPGAVPARAASGETTLDIHGLKRTNQVLAALIALLKLLDELSTLNAGDGMPPPVPPPVPTPNGHPGGGPYPVLAPDDPPLDLSYAGT